MKYLNKIGWGFVLLSALAACRSTKKLQTAINKKDTSIVVNNNISNVDSLKGASDVLKSLETKKIDFNKTATEGFSI